jgi:opine dehydrogenase
MSDLPVIAVLGGGNGGFCTVADLTLRGFEVRLYELPEFAHTLEPVLQAGGIALRGVVGEGFARPALVTTDIQAAIQDAELILVVVPSEGHIPVARACAPYIKSDQVVVLIPGNCGGALEFHQELVAHGGSQGVTIAETTTLMYAVKKEAGNSVWARGLKHYMPLAAFPASRTTKVIERLHPAFPMFSPAQNILDTSFNNLNAIVHPAGMLMNMGFIEGQRLEEWYFYKDGFTESIGRVGNQLDRERLAIVRAFGLPEVSVVETLCRYYGHQGLNGGNLYELFRDSPIHHPARGPKTTQHRMVSEDVPYGLVPLASFGRLAGVPTPTIDAVITVASVVNQCDYRSTGRTVEGLGLGGLSPTEILHYVTNGPN